MSFVVGLTLGWAAVLAGITDPPADIQIVAKQGRGTAEGRAAWDRLCQGGPELLLPLLGAMDTTDTVAANWLRTAFDHIADRELAKKGKIDADALLQFAGDPKRNGR